MRIQALPCLLFAATLGTAASAQVAPPPGTSLPFFDARLDDEGLPAPAVRAAVAAARTEEQRNARAGSLAELRRAVRGVRVDSHEFFGTPHFVRSTLEFLTEPAPGRGARAVARDFVAAHEAFFEVAPAELDQARVSWDYVTRHNGVQHLTLQQEVRGVDLYGAVLKANVTRNGELINISSTLLPRPAGGFPVAEPLLGPFQALLAGAEHVGVEPQAGPVALTQPSGANAAQTWAWADFRPEEPVTTELVYFPRTRTDVRPSWKLVLPEKGVGNTYELWVDALDGTVLRRWNRLHFLTAPVSGAAAAAAGGSEPISLRVYASDSPTPFSPGHSTPSAVQPPEVSRDFLTLDPGDVLPASPDHWIDDGDNETLGNNVDAHTDLDANNSPDLPRPQGSPYRVFDFPVDLGDDPLTYSEAAVTNMFYHCNLYHDRLYELGWDEAAKNFQDDNFGLGGVGGDRLSADSQDGSFTNNANFNGSGSDGSSGRIQMFLWDGPTPNRDGDLDAEIIYHEYSHGLSIRLSDGTVSGEQSGGMGEGWGDYYAISLLAEPTDDPHGVFALGGYSVLDFFDVPENYYFGIRRFPFTTDMSKSPLTYADLDPAQFAYNGSIPAHPLFIGNPADEVHNVGELWTQALLEVRAFMWDEIGFSANETLLQLVTDGLKLQPQNPNFLQARDAILQADLVDNGGANLGFLWEGFAKRGMGAAATSPEGGSSTTGVSEAFNVPPLILFSYPQSVPSELDPGVPTTFTVEISALGDETPLPGTGTLSVSTNGGSFVTSPMVESSPGVYEATLPPSDCFDELRFYASVDSTAGVVSDPANPADAYEAIVFTGIAPVFTDDFESDLGWQVGLPGDDATTGIWERVDPVGTLAQPEIDVTSDPGAFAWVTGQGVPGGGLGDNDVDGGKTTLVSPVIDLSAGDAEISYWRWYSNVTGAEPEADVFVVDISNDGGSNWTNVETVGPTGAEVTGGWIFHRFTVSDFVAPTASVVLRFVASDEAGGSLVEAALDEFRVERLLCETCQEDLGFGGPGSSVLSVCGDALVPGATADVLLEGAPASAPAFLVYSLSQNPTPVAGGTLVPVPILAVVSQMTDGDGEIFLPDALTFAGGPADLFLQYLVQDAGQAGGFQFSNAVRVGFLP